MSFWELSVVIIIGLLVIGPARLPEAIKTGYTWFARIKRAVNDAKKEFEQHIGADEIRRELHNEKILKSLSELKTLQSDLDKSVNTIHSDDHHHDHDHHHDDDFHHDHHDDHHKPVNIDKAENTAKTDAMVKTEKATAKTQEKSANTTAHKTQKPVTNTETEQKIS